MVSFVLLGSKKTVLKVMLQHGRGWTDRFLIECLPVLPVSWRVLGVFRLQHTALNRSSTWFGQCRISVSLRVPTALNSTTGFVGEA